MNQKRHFILQKLRRWLLPVLFLVVAILAFFVLRLRSEKSVQNYKEILPESRLLRTSVISTGMVEPQGRIEIKPPVPGRLEKILVREGQRVRRGQILAWMSSTERAALLDAARAEGEAEYRRFAEYYRPIPLSAPITGSIILRNAEPGQTVAANDVLLVIADSLQVVARVDETDIARVKVGMPAEVVLDAYPNEVIPARVRAIAYESKTVNNVTTYEVEIACNRVPDFMRSGMTANVAFIVEEKNVELALPVAAIQYRNGMPFVLVKTPNAKPREQDVILGISDGSFVEITSGISAGATVLIPTLPQGSEQAANPFFPMRGPSKGSSKKIH